MGKSVSTPPVPDYVAAAKEQGAQNLTAAKQGSVLSNPNVYTPFGTQTVSYSSPTFDQSRYDADLAAFNQKSKGINRNDFMVSGGTSGGESDSFGGGGTYFDDAAYQRALKDVGAAPDRQAYMTGGGVPTVTQSLTPDAQAAVDAQMRVQRRLAELGGTAMGNVQNVLSQPFTPTSTTINKDFADYGRAQNTVADYGRAMNEVPLTTNIDTSNFSNMPLNAGVTAQDLILSRLQPTIERGDTSFKQALANQGLAPGTEAYNAAFRNREMSKNDLYNQAALQGIGLDMSARQQQLNEALGIGGFENQAQLARANLYNTALGQDYGTAFNRAGLYNQALNQDFSQGLQRAQFGNQAQQQQLAQDLALRNQPLNELAAIMSGSQVQLPQFPGYTPAQVAPPPTFGATQAQYQGQLAQANAQNAANSQLTQGLFQLGGTALLAPTGTFSGPTGLFSDRRLKTDIKQIGVADNGLNIYSYKYIWGGPTQIGYMADEVEKVAPQAVGQFNGYKTVDYGMI